MRVIPQLDLQRRQLGWPKLKRKWPHLSNLELQKIDYSQVTVLFGRDVRVRSALEEIRVPPGNDGPDAILTPFGWCAKGPV